MSYAEIASPEYTSVPVPKIMVDQWEFSLGAKTDPSVGNGYSGMSAHSVARFGSQIILTWVK